MEYEIYHDESKEWWYRHAFLYVPLDKKDAIYNYLISIKNKINPAVKELSFKDIKSKGKHRYPPKLTHDKPKIIKYRLSYILATMHQQKYEKFKPQYLCIEKQITTLEELYNVKLVILNVKDDHVNMYDSIWTLEKIETTMRIGLKWWLHWLFKEEENISIKNFYIDWHEHYKLYWDRDSLDFNRIIGQLKKELKSWITLDENIEIISTPKRDGNFNEINRLFIQITDLLLWATRFLNQDNDPTHVKYKVSEPIKNLLERNWDYYNIESRFFKWFMLSEVYIENNEWVFNKITCNKQSNIEQKSLF